MPKLFNARILILVPLIFCLTIQAAEESKLKSAPQNPQTPTQNAAAEQIPEPNFNWGIGMSLIDYSQESSSKITQLWTHLQAAGHYPLSAQLALEGRSSLGIFTLSKSGSNLGLRLFQLGTGLSVETWAQSEEGFVPTVGYQYESILNSEDLGFKNIHGPYADITYRLKTKNDHMLIMGLGYSFFATNSRLSTTNNELMFRAAYNWRKKTNKDMDLTLEGKLNRLSLRFNNGGVGVYIYEINLIKSF